MPVGHAECVGIPLYLSGHISTKCVLSFPYFKTKLSQPLLFIWWLKGLQAEASLWPFKCPYILSLSHSCNTLHHESKHFCSVSDQQQECHGSIHLVYLSDPSIPAKWITESPNLEASDSDRLSSLVDAETNMTYLSQTSLWIAGDFSQQSTNWQRAFISHGYLVKICYVQETACQTHVQITHWGPEEGLLVWLRPSTGVR